MNRSLAALCVCSLATHAIAGVTYSTDNRFVQAVNSFGQNSAKTPTVPFAPFNETVQTNTDRAEGACASTSHHDSIMNASHMSGTATISANAETKVSSALAFASSGNSRFDVFFTPDASSTLHLTGTLGGTAGKSTLSVQLKQGSTILFSRSASGSFNYQAPLAQNQQYRIIVSCAANTLLTWTGTPASAASTADFSFNADISTACPGDLNLDGVVDDVDFGLFAPAYNLLDCADPTMPAGCPADLNRDGLVDDIDFTIFVPAYDALICP